MGFTISRQSVPAIVVPQEAAEPVRFASQELKRYLGRVLGKKPIITQSADAPAIALKICKDTNLSQEGYEIRTDGQTLTISAPEPVGVVFGTYYFLTQYVGCRFTGLPPDGEYIPQRESVEIGDVAVRRKPKLWYRGLQFSKTEGLNDYPAETAIKRIDWMAKNGMNFVLYTPKYQFGEGGADRFYTDTWFFRHIYPEVRKRGLKLDMNHHNLFYWLPPEKYFKKHPEWYALRNGKRSAYPAQLAICTSNAQAVQTLVQNVLAYLREHPEVEIVGVIPEDGWGMCECEECRKLDFPDEKFCVGPVDYRKPEGENRSKARRYALLVNEVARAVKKEFPSVYVGMAAYIDIQWPPRDVVLEDNVVPWVAIYWRCGAHPLGPHSCPVNTLFWDILKEWKKAHVGRLILYEYYMGMATYRSLPFPVAEVMIREWPGLKKLGVDGATIQSTGESHETYGLNYYTFARLGWEDNLEYEKVLDDYLLGMFGSVASEVRPIWETLVGNLQKIEKFGTRVTPYKESVDDGCFTQNAWEFNALADSRALEGFRACCRRALKKAVTDRERRQVEMLLASIRYWELAGRAMDVYFRATQADKKDEKEKAVKLYKDFISQVDPILDYEARFVGRGWMGLSNDADQWRRSGERARRRIEVLTTGMKNV